MIKIGIILPTYNEAANIEPLIAQIQEIVPAAEIIVVDDNSPDGTQTVINKLRGKNKFIHLVSRNQKTGLKSAYQAGFDFAIKLGVEAVLQMDADFSHRPQDMKPMLEAFKHADLVVGSRYERQSSVANWTWLRIIVGRCAREYIQLVLKLNTSDPLGGFNLYRTELLKKINYSDLKLKGFAFQMELKWLSMKNGARIIDVPIVFDKRLFGKSKIPWLNTMYVLIGALSLRFRSQP